MDKLRSLHYFVAAAEEASFAGAARRHGVSVAAVAKLVGALERQLGIKLFERHAKGLALTGGGRHYLEACKPAMEQLAAADELAVAATSQARGTVVVGVQPVIAQECLTAALPQFRAMYPEIDLDIRFFMGLTEEAAQGVDVFLVLGWPKVGDLVQRHIGAASFVVCASPVYWARHGMPRHPSELQRHHCLCIRSVAGTLMDLWQFRRGDEQVAVPVRGWLMADNAHRDMVLDLAIAGAGVVRLLDWHRRSGHEIESGALVPALVDWEQTEVNPINLLYPPNVRRIPRVRLFMDFVTQLFREIEQQRERHAPATEAPRWLKAKRPRASSTSMRDAAKA